MLGEIIIELVVLKLSEKCKEDYQDQLFRYVYDSIKQGKKVLIISSCIDERIAFMKRQFKDLSLNSTLEEKDSMNATSEVISSLFISDLLNGFGIKTKALSILEAGIVTDEEYGNANIMEIKSDFSDLFKEFECLTIPSVGISKNNHITTLGIDEGDYLAVALSIKLNAELVFLTNELEYLIDNKKKYISHESLIMSDDIKALISNKAASLAQSKKKKMIFSCIFSDYQAEVF